MTKPVPIEAAKRIRASFARLGYSGGENQVVDDYLELVEFALSFETQPLPGMSQEVVAGEMREIILTDDSLEAETFDLIRLNGRTFAPEVIEVEGPLNGPELSLEDGLGDAAEDWSR